MNYYKIMEKIRKEFKLKKSPDINGLICFSMVGCSMYYYPIIPVRQGSTKTIIVI
tara:strand:+ start:397 stop:561 length:165 start_codon:yes stop_codon:yes gene_type:complete